MSDPDLLAADGDGWVTPAMQASHLVNDLIQRLAASPSQGSEQSTWTALLADPALSGLAVDVLSRAQDAQRVTWRDASYNHPTIEQSLPDVEWRSAR